MDNVDGIVFPTADILESSAFTNGEKDILGAILDPEESYSLEEARAKLEYELGRKTRCLHQRQIKRHRNDSPWR